MTRRGGAVEVDFLSFRKLAAFFFESHRQKRSSFSETSTSYHDITFI
jgi:hypothetical protein